jgi:oligopeptide transport system permease protein
LSLAPGDALQGRVEKMPERSREQLYKNYGLDKPPAERYFITMKNLVLKGDFGESIAFPGQKVSTIIAQKAPVSIRLGLQSLFLSLVVGVALGAIAAVKKDTLFDKIIRSSVIFFAAFPSLLLAIFLQKVFAGQLGLFPVIGWPKGSDLWLGGWQWTVLPTLAIVLEAIPAYARLARNSLLDHLHSSYTLTARANGTSEKDIIIKHVLKNAAVPVITGIPVSIAAICTGTFFVENVFAIPGIGKYFVESISSRDVTTVLGLTAYFAILYIVAVAMTDILYKLVDPRIRFQRTQNTPRKKRALNRTSQSQNNIIDRNSATQLHSDKSEDR